jgi:hypothetical protein
MELILLVLLQYIAGYEQDARTSKGTVGEK